MPAKEEVIMGSLPPYGSYARGGPRPPGGSLRPKLQAPGGNPVRRLFLSKAEGLKRGREMAQVSRVRVPVNHQYENIFSFYVIPMVDIFPASVYT